MRYLILIVLVFTSVLSHAQRENFTGGDPEKFIKELSDLMQASKKKEGKELVEKEFEPVYLGTSFSSSQKARIVEFANLMRSERLKAYPHFEQFIYSLIYFPESGKTEQDFADWLIFMMKMLDDRRASKYMDEFLASSASLFKENTIVDMPAAKWQSSSDNWKLEYDSIPSIIFDNLDLKCFAKGDSSILKNTKGVYFPTLERWQGEGGRVTWERAGFDSEKTYAVLKDYEIRMKGSRYTADSVVFHNEFFQQPLLGELTEKVQADKTEETASYPRFESYNQRLQIKSIFEGVDYDGGFTMSGNKLAGSGTEEQPAILTFYYDGNPFLIARSLQFSIRPDKISSNHSEVVFFLEEDSVSHPDLDLKFDQQKRSLSLIRTEEGVSKSPYYNSFHNVDMYFGALYWNIDDPLIRLGSIRGSSEKYAGFESKDYYKEQRYKAMIGFFNVHPLIQIRDFLETWGTNNFKALDLAMQFRMPEDQIHMLLIDLNNKGFVSYDVNSREAIAKEKLTNYINASAGKRDYDVLQFNSQSDDGSNGQINLLNNNLLIKGVRSVTVSDSQRVTILPSNGEIVLQKNRNFRCGGRIFAGNLEFMGKEYFFNYDNFQIDLKQVDSCRIYVEDEESVPDQYGKRDMIRVKNVIENISGTLKIDAPTNKSGVQSEDYPQYPIFNSDKPSFVYYDNSAIQGGVYKRDDFYYTVEPFTIDSLDNFKKDDLKLEGILTSAGIFPDIEEPFVVMDDYSLGFLRDASSGLPMYAGKSQFNNDITLDYNGLQGNGELKYLSSISLSESFIFFPDSTKGRTSSFVNTEQAGATEVPKASSGEVDIAYYPGKNLLQATTVEENLHFFEQEADLEGSLFLRPQGMTGKGLMTFEGAELESQLFDYTRRKILADTSDFRLARMEGQGLAFKTNNVNADVDFDKREGLFKSNDTETKVEFPENEYICFMDQFKWFMDKSEMEMSSKRKATDDFVIDTNEDAARSNFFSVNEMQDSLNFLAPKAVYDIRKSLITADKIKYIAIADSKVTPDSGKVVIRKRAKMDPLENATVLSNYVTQYHRIFNAELQISGRLDYEGAGDYAYKDENNREQIIHLNTIEVDTSYQTIGSGTIKEEDQFYLSPFFEFYGDFRLSANEKNLTFNGGARILHECDVIERNWLKFEAPIDPLAIYIPIDTGMTDTRSSQLGAGVMLTNDSPFSLYSTFLSAKEDRKDLPILNALGYLYYDKNKKAYLIGEKDKIKNANLPGQLLRLSTESCEISGNGVTDFYSDLGLVGQSYIGDIKNFGLMGELEFKGVSTLDFLLDNDGWKRLTEQIIEWPDLKGVDLTKTKYEQSIVQTVGLEKSDKLISELSLNGQLKKIPDELQKSLYLADVTFTWNDADQAFQSAGLIGIAHIGKRQVFRYVKGKIEIEKRRSFDVMRIYIELNPANWYYFEYKNEIMTVSSSDKEFMNILTEVKDDKRKLKEDGKKYSWIVTNTPKKKSDFISRFREFD